MRESRQVGWLGHLCLLCFVSGYRGEMEVIARSEYARPSLIERFAIANEDINKDK